MVSFLGSGASFIPLSSVPISHVFSGWYSEGFIHSLSSVVAVLLCSLPLDMLVACFRFPFFKCPGDVCYGIIIWRAYNCFDEFSFEVIFKDFDSSSIIELDVGIFG